MQGEGFWIKRNEINEVENGSSHVKKIISAPEYFGITKEYIESCYKKHDEVVPMEGKARDEIIQKVICNGFIRVRHYLTPVNYWSLQCFNYSESRQYIVNLIKEKNINHNESIKIKDLSDNKVYDFAYDKGGIETFLKGAE